MRGLTSLRGRRARWHGGASLGRWPPCRGTRRLLRGTDGGLGRFTPSAS